MGYNEEIKDRAGWKKWFNEQLVDGAWKKFIANKNKAKPGEGDRIAKEVEEKGFALVNAKKYDQTP